MKIAIASTYGTVSHNIAIKVCETCKKAGHQVEEVVLTNTNFATNPLQLVAYRLIDMSMADMLIAFDKPSSLIPHGNRHQIEMSPIFDLSSELIQSSAFIETVYAKTCLQSKAVYFESNEHRNATIRTMSELQLFPDNKRFTVLSANKFNDDVHLSLANEILGSLSL